MTPTPRPTVRFYTPAPDAHLDRSELAGSVATLLAWGAILYALLLLTPNG